jgi:NAD(P)-dependent dehydrogenase (short-subunit alcohol dehydrogenase family)
MKRLEGKTAVVTGAMQGIGAGISEILAEHGANVVLTDISKKVEQTSKRINNGASWRIMDVTNSEQVKLVFREIGHVDILVNNAGIYPRMKLVEMDEDFLKHIFDINVFGMYRCSKAVLHGMMERRYGKIINLSSVTGPMVGAPNGGQTAYAATGPKGGAPNGGQTAYAATRAAVIGFTKALALETAQYDINVNAILPGYIHSPSAHGLRGSSGEDPLKKMREFGYKIPMGRQGSPREVGNLVLFLASDESSYLTGSEIVIDGGNILQEEYLGQYKPKK